MGDATSTPDFPENGAGAWIEASPTGPSDPSLGGPIPNRKLPRIRWGTSWARKHICDDADQAKKGARDGQKVKPKRRRSVSYTHLTLPTILLV
eukprot:1667819-Pyramimonas_sp.AAC.1